MQVKQLEFNENLAKGEKRITREQTDALLQLLLLFLLLFFCISIYFFFFFLFCSDRSVAMTMSIGR